MTILVPDSSLRAMCGSKKLASDKFGATKGARLIQRVCELMAADTMDDFCSLHQAGVKILSAPPPAFTVCIEGPLQILVRPADPSAFNQSNQTFDWQRIKQIELLEVTQ